MARWHLQPRGWARQARDLSTSLSLLLFRLYRCETLHGAALPRLLEALEGSQLHSLLVREGLGQVLKPRVGHKALQDWRRLIVLRPKMC